MMCSMLGCSSLFMARRRSSHRVCLQVQHGRVLSEPDRVLQGRLARGRRQLLVRWKEAPASETARVDLEDFVQQYPVFQLAYELLLRGGGRGAMLCKAPPMPGARRSPGNKIRDRVC
jgi:hypothetical protein